MAVEGRLIAILFPKLSTQATYTHTRTHSYHAEVRAAQLHLYTPIKVALGFKAV